MYVRLHDHPINIISHSATRKLSPRHSSTPYDELEPRLRPKRGGLVKYSGRLRQQQTTRRRCQASRGEKPHPATRWLPRPSSATPLQCVLTNSDTRRNIPASKHCASFLLPPCAPPLVTMKGRGGQLLQGLDLLQIEHYFKGLGPDTLSRPACNPYYKHP
jgi:hypothetical protein